MIDWSRIAKLLGMLGSAHDGERLNAARLLQRQLDSAGATFGDLATRVESGGSGYVRTITIEKRAKPNPATDLATKLLRKRVTMTERFFLENILRKHDYTGGDFDLSESQANYLEAIHERFRRAMPVQRAPRAKSIPKSVLDDLGLGDAPGTYTGPKQPPPFRVMPDASDESTVASSSPLGDDVLDALGLGTVQGEYVEPPVDHHKDVRNRFGGLDLDDEIPF